jgi:hypothetical protein
MENCIVQEITTIDELEELCRIASNSNHHNASNYDFIKMKNRWNRYLIFTKLIRDGELISFAGIYDYGNNLVRVADRLYTKEEYRQNYMTKSISNLLKPALQYIIPYHTQWAMEKGYDCFFSVQDKRKRNAIIRLTKQLDASLGYRVLPDMYETCDALKNLKCIQNVSATKNNIPLPIYKDYAKS